ncbi:unnamed protein product, partial [Effrenium voratum]
MHRRLQTSEQGDPWFALLLTCLAGLATTVGAAMAFCVNTNDNRVFAVCLALSAGVMTYVSFVEIIGKADDSFQEAGIDAKDSFTLATLVFFAGLLASMLLETTAMYFFRRHNMQQKSFEKGNAGDVACAHRDPDQLANAISPQDSSQERDREEEPRIAEDVQDVEVAVQEGGASQKPLSGMERVNMLQMAAFSGVAIALHNFPEGLP